jgi:tetratricopeptide (TPR) repeat protein
VRPHRPAAGVGFLALLPVIALSFFPWVSNPFALKQDFAPLLFSAALLYWVYRGGIYEVTGSARSPSVRAAVLLLVCAAGSNLAARNPPESWLSYSLLVIGLLLYLFGHLQLWSPVFPRRFAETVFWTSLPISLLGMAQAVFPGRLDFGLQALGKMAAFSTLGNPQFVAAWLVFSIPLYPALARTRASAWARIGAAMVALAALACLLLTRSASGLLALAAVGVFGLLFRTSRAGFPRTLVGVGLLLPVVAGYLGWSSHTGRGRIMIWMETLLIWARHPWLGVGLGQYNLHQVEAQHQFFALGEWTRTFHQNAAFVLDAHNQYLQILAEQGLLGFGLFVFLICVIVRHAGRRIAHDPLTRGLATAWCGLLVLFLWNAPLFYFPVLALFWITGGILDQLAEPSEVLQAAPRRWLVLAPASAILLCASCVLFWVKLRAGVLEKKGDALLEHGPFPEAVESFAAALRWAPQNGYAWEKLGLAQYFSGDYDAALGSLEMAQERFGDVGVLYLEAEILTRRKDYPRAIRLFEFIRDAFPQHVTPSFALGQIFKAQGDYRRAEREFVRVLRLPDSRENLKLDRKKIQIQKALAFRFLDEIRGIR